jgi:hypothetical protein
MAAEPPATLGTSVEGMIDANPEKPSYYLHLVMFPYGLKTVAAQYIIESGGVMPVESANRKMIGLMIH